MGLILVGCYFILQPTTDSAYCIKETYSGPVSSSFSMELIVFCHDSNWTVSGPTLRSFQWLAVLFISKKDMVVRTMGYHDIKYNGNLYFKGGMH